mmetsp:Transcript_21582/g.59976  ORF Transcript_21582/g.59976 Transcript_21582/m.59976 type:complete len:242 (-) Transcript_21582:87-812(-)
MACSVHIKWVSHERIGRVELPQGSNTLGSSIWRPAQEAAAQFFGVEWEHISVLHVEQESVTISVESASNLNIRELHDCDVVVELPDLSLASLWKERTQSQTSQELRESNTELLRAVRRLTRRSARLAMRCLVEEVRKKILDVGSEADLTQEQKQHWNRVVDDYTGDELLALGLSKADLWLTKYGDGSLQQFGGRAAHDFSKEEIADEVMAAKNHKSCLAKLFLFVYGESAEAVAFHDAEGY